MIDFSLRWLSMCDENGRWSKDELQYWDGYEWQPVPVVTCKTWEEDEYMKKKE